VLNDSEISARQLEPYATPALVTPVVCSRSKLKCAWQALRLARRAQRVICGHMHLLRLAHLARRFTPALEIWLIAHGIEVWRDFTPAERRALASTDRVLCVSDFTRQQMLARCPELNPARLVVQPNALDPQFEAAPRPGSLVPGLILSVARLNASEAYKGIDHLIAALPAIRAAVPTARLRIVGDGDDRPRLQNIAAQAGVASHVEFTGRVNDAALREHFAQCALFALPSRGEGFGIVFLEALAHGKPCLAANAGGAPEVVNSGSCGALVTFGDVNAIARSCADALQRDWNATTLRARAAEFSYAAFRDRLAALWHPAAA
jgi:glycosyltransferase involved in cell wall biosynthesis